MTVRIICGDAREVLPTLQADALITDPVWPNSLKTLAGADRPYELFAESMAVIPPSVRRLVIILRSDSDPRFLSSVPRRFPFVCVQAMAYAVPMYLGRVLGGTELAYCFGEPVPVSEGRRVIPMWGPKAQPTDRPENGHPCSRSLVHMRWLVNWWSEPGETVVDPYCGSGTITLAARQLDRHSIGVEIDPRYARMARDRIDAADPLFAPLRERQTAFAEIA